MSVDVRSSQVPDVADVSASSGEPRRAPERDATYSTRRLDPPDEELMRRVSEGQSEALAAVYDRHARAAYSLARRICGEEEAARRVVHEVFVQTWRDPSPYDPRRGALAAWLLTQVQHAAVDSVHQDGGGPGRMPPKADAADRWAVGPAPEGVLVPVLGEQARDAMQGLAADQRRGLALAWLGGYTLREIAAITGTSMGTVRSRMFTAVHRLRRALLPLRWESAEPTGGQR
jgi:RNA polymerase sigma factor (sigma-70 family)